MKRIRPRALAIGIVSLVFAYINTFKQPNFSQGEYDNRSKVHNMMITQQDQIDTSIIITSNLIPTHPSIAMINETINSLHRHLIGLSLDTPMFLTIDGLRPEKEIDNKKNVERLGEYIERLKNYTEFPFRNVTVLPNPTHLHIARTVKRAMQFVQTKFVYVLQHDLPFARDVYHTELIQAMTDHPDKLRNILFKLEGAVGRFPVCPVYNSQGTYPTEEYQGLSFYATKRWSDNNQLSTKSYYEEILSFPHMNGAPEWGMMGPAKANCTYWGQTVYGTRADNFLKHLDGRHAATIES